jgi:hypothetical protein
MAMTLTHRSTDSEDARFTSRQNRNPARDLSYGDVGSSSGSSDASGRIVLSWDRVFKCT